ncbi:hypothetical protein KP509_05G023400 [Ceratopteris richardii]|nr:hypothetical protein KP509_05G023400 [Ceratopteris richardii]
MPDVTGGDGSWKSLELEIESLLGKLVDVNDYMSRCAVAAAPASVAQKLARHRDILHEFTQEFKRARANIKSLREHAELLTSVHNDISNEYKASGSSSPSPSLLRERAAIHNNITQIDEVIIQAQSTKGALSTQRSMFIEIEGKVKHLSDRFPIIRSILGAIKRKRSRDTLILAAVIASCILFLVIYWLFK